MEIVLSASLKLVLKVFGVLYPQAPEFHQNKKGQSTTTISSITNHTVGNMCIIMYIIYIYYIYVYIYIYHHPL